MTDFEKQPASDIDHESGKQGLRTVVHLGAEAVQRVLHPVLSGSEQLADLEESLAPSQRVELWSALRQRVENRKRHAAMVRLDKSGKI